MRLDDASFGKYIGIPMRLSALKPSLIAGVCRSRGLPTGKPSVLALAMLARDLKISRADAGADAPALARHLPFLARRRGEPASHTPSPTRRQRTFV